MLVLQQNRLRWYGHVLRKDDDDWVKKCMEYEVEGPRPTGRITRIHELLASWKVMAAYRQVYDSVTCKLTAKNWDEFRKLMLG